MDTQTSLSTLFAQYQTLCRYCDTYFDEAYQTYQSQMRCGKGCASCCILETVVPLEATVIASYASTIPDLDVSTFWPEQEQTPCVFLNQNLCAIYPVRPIICRTHGLLLVYPEQHTLEVCPLNFTEMDLSTPDEHILLNAESVTDNLLRLNLAFCTLIGQPDTAGERISLNEISAGQYHAPITLAFESD